MRRALKTRAVGHAGTLDPFATGLLVILVGKATRLARFAEQQPKTYLATARLGFATTTDDGTGDRIAQDPASATAEGGRSVRQAGPEVGPRRDPTEGEVSAALESFLGTSRQRPPAYSAKKVAGERSYALARRGQAVELAEVPITVFGIELLEYRFPAVVFRTTVSPGSYIRGMARDLGDMLGTGGHLTALRREAIGAMRVTEAVSLEQVSVEALRSPLQAVAQLPRLVVTEAEAKALSFGKAIETGATPEEPVVALTARDEVIAIGRIERGAFFPAVVLEAAG